MKTVTFEIDDEQVCSECGTNDQLHYNFYAYAHRSETRAMADPECSHYCDCGGDVDVSLMTREEFLKSDKFRQEMLTWMEENTND